MLEIGAGGTGKDVIAGVIYRFQSIAASQRRLSDRLGIARAVSAAILPHQHGAQRREKLCKGYFSRGCNPSNEIRSAELRL